MKTSADIAAAIASAGGNAPQHGHATSQIPVRLILGLGAMTMVGALLLRLPVMAKQGSLSWNEAVFTSVSALTVTGLTIINPFNDLTGMGKIVLMLLMQFGGVGYMVLAVTAFSLMGRRISHSDRLALVNSLGLISPGGIMQLFWSILAAVTVVELLGALVLWWHWRGILPNQEAAFYGLFHAVSAFCNAGFDLFTGRPGFPGGVPADAFTLTVMGGLILLGSLGIPVLHDLANWTRRRKISLNSRITIILVFCLVVLGGLTFVASEGSQGGALSGISYPRMLLLGWFEALSRTAGFAPIPDFAHIKPATALLMIVLMFIGSAPASMGGGITTGTFAALFLAMWAHVRGWDTPRVGGRALPGEMVRRASAVLTVSLAVVVIATWLVLVTHRASLQVTCFEVVSAFATCGLSLGLTRKLDLFGQILIMFMMFWGRLGALTVIVALTRPRPRRLVSYPEERVLIG